MGVAASRLRRRWRTLIGDATSCRAAEEEPGDVVSGRALDLVLRVGELLLASGEATERVNESMLSLAVAYELPRVEVSVTFTVISVSVHPGKGALPVTGGRAIRRRIPAYWRLVALHALIQEASLGMLDVEEAHRPAPEDQAEPAAVRCPLSALARGDRARSDRLVGSRPGGRRRRWWPAPRSSRRCWPTGPRPLGRRGIAEFFQLAVAASIGRERRPGDRGRRVRPTRRPSSPGPSWRCCRGGPWSRASRTASPGI